MAKKSIEYRLLHALNIAKANSDARILFASGTDNAARLAWAELVNLVGKPNGFTYKLLSREAIHEDGGSVFVRGLDDRNSISGFQVTHAFVDEWCTDEDRDVVTSKVRVARGIKLKEPSGVYDVWGVTRREDY